LENSHRDVAIQRRRRKGENCAGLVRDSYRRSPPVVNTERKKRWEIWGREKGIALRKEGNCVGRGKAGDWIARKRLLRPNRKDILLPQWLFNGRRQTLEADERANQNKRLGERGMILLKETPFARQPKEGRGMRPSVKS